MDHVSGVRDQRFGQDFIGAVQGELPVFDEVLQKRRDVLGVHLAGVVGNGGRQIDGAEDLDTAGFHHFAGPSQFAISAALGGDVHNHRSGRHAGDHFAGDEDGRFLSRHGGGGDDHVLTGQNAAHQLALAAVKLFAHGFGVATFVFGPASLHVEHHEAGAEALDLLLYGGTNVVAADHGSQPFGGGDGLKSGDGGANHQPAGR